MDEPKKRSPALWVFVALGALALAGIIAMAAMSIGLAVLRRSSPAPVHQLEDLDVDDE